MPTFRISHPLPLLTLQMTPDVLVLLVNRHNFLSKGFIIATYRCTLGERHLNMTCSTLRAHQQSTDTVTAVIQQIGEMYEITE